MDEAQGSIAGVKGFKVAGVHCGLKKDGKLDFSLIDQTKLVTATSELSRNALVYGGGGEMRWELLSEGQRSGLRLHFQDEGPGIADVEIAMTDGWTSGNGLGLGLSGSRRLVNEFEIRTAIGQGTRVSITRWR